MGFSRTMRCGVVVIGRKLPGKCDARRRRWQISFQGRPAEALNFYACFPKHNVRIAYSVTCLPE